MPSSTQKPNPALQGLVSASPRTLNAAYTPPWQMPNDPTSNYEASAPLQDPFVGTGWGQALDAMGASQPGGIRMGASKADPTGAGGFADLPSAPLTSSPMQGLQAAGNQDSIWNDMAQGNAAIDKRARLAQIQNMASKPANPPAGPATPAQPWT